MKNTSGLLWRLSLFLLLPLLLGACSPADQALEPTESLLKTIHPATLTAISEAAESDSTPEPETLAVDLGSLMGLEIDFWYLWDLDEPGQGMNAIVERFNQDNEWGIVVNAVDQGLTHDPMDSIETALAEGLVPDVMVSDSTSAADWFRRGLLVDLARYSSLAEVGLTDRDEEDYYPGIYQEFGLPDGARPGLPFTQMIQVIYYNQTWAADLGYSYAPGSLEEFLDQACKAGEQESDPAKITGLALYPEASNVAGWLYSQGGQFQDPLDGTYQFTSPELFNVARIWRDLTGDGCAALVSSYPNPMAMEIEFDLLNTRQALMVMNSARYVNLISLSRDNGGSSDQWTMLPFFGPDNEKVVPAEVQTGVIFKTSPEKELAAWLFTRYLTSPEIQAEWIEYSGYYPTRKDSLRFLRDYRTSNPDWAKGVNLLKYSQTEPLDPAWDIVKQAVGDAFEELLLDETMPAIQILSRLDAAAVELKSIVEQ